MKHIRNAALAAATALSIVLTGTTAIAAEGEVAQTESAPATTSETAPATDGKGDNAEPVKEGEKAAEGEKAGEGDKAPETNPQPNPEPNTDEGKKEGEQSQTPAEKPGLSSEGTFDKDGNLTEQGKNVLETDQSINGDEALSKESDKLPAWAKLWRTLTAAGVIGSFFGLIVFPIINFLKFQGVIR